MFRSRRKLQELWNVLELGLNLNQVILFDGVVADVVGNLRILKPWYSC